MRRRAHPMGRQLPTADVGCPVAELGGQLSGAESDRSVVAARPTVDIQAAKANAQKPPLETAAMKSSARTNSCEPLARPGCRREQPDVQMSTLRMALGPAATSAAPGRFYEFTPRWLYRPIHRHRRRRRDTSLTACRGCRRTGLCLRRVAGRALLRALIAAPH